MLFQFVLEKIPNSKANCFRVYRKLITWSTNAIIDHFKVLRGLEYRLRAVSLFSVVRRAKRETRKWPRAWLTARDERGTKKERLPAKPDRMVFHVSSDFSASKPKCWQCFSNHQLVNCFDCWQFVVNATQISQSYFALWGQRLIHWLWLSWQSLFFLLGLPPSFRSSRGFAAPARVQLFSLNVKKKRDCSQSIRIRTFE